MEQFRRIGEVIGSMKALMVFSDNIQINQRQCNLLLEICSFGFDSIAEEMKHGLKIEEQHTKWRILEQPLRELYKIFKESEFYIRQSLETKNWFAKAIVFYQNSDCVHFHIHNLLNYIPVVIEAIETAGELSGFDQDEIQKKRVIYSKKYDKLWKDPKLFEWKFGKQYLITQDFRERIDTCWKEDRWILLDKIREKNIQFSSKDERNLRDVLLRNLGDSGPENGRLLPSSFLLKSKDYNVRKRLGSGSQYKEIQWLGESLAMRHFFGDIESLNPEISSLLSLSHPNISGFYCGFTDEEKRECFLVMELMSKDLCSYIKELCGPRNRIPFSVPVAVDLMLQIARGMEYLHSKKIYHGNLSPYSILVKPRNSSVEGYLQAKISGFGLQSVKNMTQKSLTNLNETTLPFIWYAPEVLEEAEQRGFSQDFKYSEKSDVYSFGMVCFELLTGKVPFEDSHLQGDKMSRNIRAGERPLFPLNSPKYVTNLTKRCWHTDPNQRPSFSSICRILRYTKRFLAMNPDYNREADPLNPAVDYCDLETNLQREFGYWDEPDSGSVTHIPFQMYVFRAFEKEKIRAIQKGNSESGSDKASISEDENASTTDDTSQLPPPVERSYPICSSPTTPKRKPFVSKKSPDQRTSRQPGTPRARSRPPQLAPCKRSLSMNSANQLANFSPRMIRRSSFGHASDSELSDKND